MDIKEAFQKFYKNIKLTKLQRQDAKVKYVGVCKKLHDHYYPESEYDGSTKLVIGSYGKHTNIRPPRDVDVIFIMPKKKFEDYSDNSSNPQSQLLQDVKHVLSEKYTTTEEIRPWGKVVLIKFADGTHDVEVLPAWENDDGSFKIPNSENGGSWEDWDARSEIENINEFENNNGITRMLIRTIKKWSDNCTARVKTYEIENTVLEFLFNRSLEDKTFQIVIKDFFDYFRRKETNTNTNSHLNTAYNRSENACNFEENGELGKASEEWIKIFGDDFPVIDKEEEKTTMESRINELQKEYPTTDEMFLDSDFGIPFNLNPSYKVKIDAWVDQDGGFVEHWLSKIIILRKSKKLTFQIVEPIVISGEYRIKWKVRNFGEEAMNANDLRGEITDDKGLSKKVESTKYEGEHYVECYIIQNNQCVAMDRKIVPIGSSF